MNETHVNIKGEWWYYYRAVDKNGDVVDFYLSQECDENAARAFLRKAIGLLVVMGYLKSRHR